MKTKYFFPILIAGTVVHSACINILSQSVKAQTSEPSLEADSSNFITPPEDRVSFYCSKSIDSQTGEAIPTTVAYSPQKQGNIAIIAWKSDYIPQWDAQTRCETVSPKFDTFYQDSRLNYLTTGKNNGYDIICAAPEKGKPCNAEDQLFQVKANSDPQAVLRGLTGTFGGNVNKPIYQSSGEKIFVSIEELLDASPTLEESN